MSEETEPSQTSVLIIGAGLAGLSCAVRLHEAGCRVQVLESSDGVGGRVRTDEVDGFLLDRGFQVYLDAYPEAGKILDLAALDLRPFEPGTLVWKRGKLRSIMDVFRRPGALISSARQPIGSIFDKLLVAKLRWKLMRKPLDEIWSAPETSTADYLRDFGFSERMIDDFFRGFYGGIFLEDLLVTSSRIFEFTFKMFSLGSATLPSKGMQAIPGQLAARLPKEAIQCNCPVLSLEGTTARLTDAILEADQIVVAMDGTSAHGLLPERPEPKWNSTSCLYFAADIPPIEQAIIALKGDRDGLINSVCVPSQIASGYGSGGQSLVSVSVLGDQREREDLAALVIAELVDWFGEVAIQWKHLRTEHIRKALPIDPPGHQSQSDQEGPVFVCGDYTHTGSIEGAILSGLRVADQILAHENQETISLNHDRLET